ncbi:MAG TPA: hypothetical protein PKA88_08885 [Polyangiaceae bacterium]|nr:hypothetical protein [Polyangiaceae bacterium]HMR75722.1 hypothetical protein [Polyangiaceae bacterium]
MTRRTRWNETIALSAVVLALLACKRSAEQEQAPPAPAAPAAPAAAAGNHAGTYTISAAANPGGGGGYKGSVDISAVGSAFKLKWTLEGQPGYSGVGIDQDGILGVGWGTGERYGVVVYQVDGGTLKGRWATSAAEQGVGLETATGPEGLSGTYQVVGTNPVGGNSYKGALAIAPAGSIYTVAWSLTSGEKYSGIGILEGKTFVVGWGIGGSAGVVLYKSSGTGLDGKWATPGNTAVGTETLARN